MIEFNEAVQRMLEPIRVIGAEHVPLLSAVGRILAEEIYADSNVPFSRNSAMDGYAVIASDIAGASREKPVALKVIGEVAAGDVATARVERGTAMRIFTGAPVPDGADAVLMQENADRDGDNVLVKKRLTAGANIRESGEDLKTGQKIFDPGRKLSAADIGVIASCGKSEVKVGHLPTIGILSTGNEVIEPDVPAGPGKVRNTNGYTIHALSLEAGANPKYMGIIPDDRAALEKALEKAASECDLVITTGGVSVGDYDHVTEILREKGRVDFWKIAIKPGKPLAYGTLCGKPFVGLPGNPVSSMVGFELFVRPIILKMAGAEKLFRERLSAKMTHAHKEKPERLKVLRGVYTREGGDMHVRTTGPQGSGVLTSMSQANCFIFIPDGIGEVNENEIVEICPLDVK